MRQMPVRHRQITLSEDKRANLKKLADFLVTIEDSSHFDMHYFNNLDQPEDVNWSETEEEEYQDTVGEFFTYVPAMYLHLGNDSQEVNLYKDQLHKCGTTACALGYGPVAGIVPAQSIEWADYAEQYFLPDDQYTDYAMNWLFERRWEDIDNTPQGAANRIYYLLEYGLPVGAVYLVQGERVDFSNLGQDALAKAGVTQQIEMYRDCMAAD